MSDRKSVLVLCTGNSCRSQMAAAYLEAFAGDRLEVESAGTRPAAAIHPLTLKVLAEDGLDLSNRRPASYDPFLGKPLDTLLVVCGGAAHECPNAWPGVKERVAWDLDDPALFQGSPEETVAEFRRIRDEIKKRVRSWLDKL